MDKKTKLGIVQQWFKDQAKVITPDGEGVIQEMPEASSGVWGYGGDTIAVYINNKPYPAFTLIEMNPLLCAMKFGGQ